MTQNHGSKALIHFSATNLTHNFERSTESALGELKLLIKVSGIRYGYECWPVSIQIDLRLILTWTWFSQPDVNPKMLSLNLTWTLNMILTWNFTVGFYIRWSRVQVTWNFRTNFTPNFRVELNYFSFRSKVKPEVENSIQVQIGWMSFYFRLKSRSKVACSNA